jgi:hypothetical protein
LRAVRYAKRKRAPVLSAIERSEGTHHEGFHIFAGKECEKLKKDFGFKNLFLRGQNV